MDERLRKTSTPDILAKFYILLQTENESMTLPAMTDACSENGRSKVTTSLCSVWSISE
jgi:hypothetical protein